MKERLSTLILEEKEKLICQLQLAGYAFAAWQMPHNTDYRLIISLKRPVRIKGSFGEMDKGFIINKFSDNHPVHPYHITADIVIEKEEISIDPRIKDLEIDEFIQKLNASNDSRKRQGTGAVPITNSGSEEYESLVAQAVREIRNGTFEKVVLSRYKDELLPDDFSAWDFFQKLCASYSASFCSLSYIPGFGLWIGATPELLLSDSGIGFKTIALAGTKALDPGQHLSEIAWTQKEIEEQALVSRYIINCFKKIRLREFHEHGPKTVQAGNLTHLKTEFEVNCREIRFEGLGEQMLELLHPTSAVCGMPIELTKPWIQKVEGYDRAFYSGFLGPVHFDDSVNLFVNLRCMKIEEERVRFFAGAGITEDSIPEKEFEETEMKMNVLKSKLTK